VQKTPATPGEPRLVLRDVVARNDRGLIALDRVSLTVRAGEIVGIAGVAGNGQTELAEVIYGMRPVESGTIEIGGRDVTNAHPLVTIEAGVAYVPEDRRGMGSAPNHSVAENLALKAYRRPPIGRGLFIDRARMRALARDLVARFQIATPSVETPVRKLSGGNLQKVILAREIAGEPHVIIAAYPSRGLDIGATETVHRCAVRRACHGDHASRQSRFGNGGAVDGGGACALGSSSGCGKRLNKWETWVERWHAFALNDALNNHPGLSGHRPSF